MKKLSLCAAATSCFVALACSAHARSAYDGSWVLAFVTQRGACDPTYNFTVNVSNGIVTHPNLLKFRIRREIRRGSRFGERSRQIRLRLRQTLQRLWPRDMARLRRKCAMLGLLDRATKLTFPHGEEREYSDPRLKPQASGLLYQQGCKLARKGHTIAHARSLTGAIAFIGA